jgi:hypothetical protein
MKRKANFKYGTVPEVILGNVPPMQIPEVKVRYNRSTRKKFLGKLTSSKDVADFIRSCYKRGEIELQEQFVVLFLNQANNIIGYYKHSVGGISGTVADPRIILSAALKCAAVSIIIAHNHPSGNLQPSEADKQITRKLNQAAQLMDIRLLEHLIITKESFYSFAENLGLDGLSEVLSENETLFVLKVKNDLALKAKHNKKSIEKLASAYSITDRTEIKELTELAIVNRARDLAHAEGTVKERFENIVELYQAQVNLSHRTSQSMMLQQYSTPAPISYLAGVFCGIGEFTKNETGFEPSAGNGLLTVAGLPENFTVNEIDFFRNRNLQTQGFAKILKTDATASFHFLNQHFDAVLTNPPFGTMDAEVKYETFPIKPLEHVMALRALDVMKDDGRAAIIIGGHTKWDEKGRIQAGANRIFFNYLYSRYNVADVLQIDGSKLYSRQGTSFNVRLILIAGRKAQPQGAAPVFDDYRDKVVKTFDTLLERVQDAIDTAKEFNSMRKKLTNNIAELEKKALEYLQFLNSDAANEELGMPYTPASDACVVLNTQVPDSMGFETHQAIGRIKAEVGGSIDNLVRHRLAYHSKMEMCHSLSAEQTDAVAMGIYNIEARGEGIIIGDQTGIGKGRIAAAMIRYAVQQGLKPVFITEKANLFSDIYRDLSAIGSAHLKPFIVNGRESKTDIKDEDGNVVYQALPPTEQSKIFKSQKVPAEFDFVVGTYSQFNSPDRKPEKPAFLKAIADGNILIMDEAHNSSGSSNVGEFMQKVVSVTKGVIFLSATFAKRPDNMPIYAMKTAISDCNMSRDELVDAITKGGVALQEILASQLVAEGQMLRRERSFEGIEVNYITLENNEPEHKAIADNITEILRDIIAFQGNHIDTEVEELDKIAVAEGKEVVLREGTSQAGVDNLPYFSKVFQVINQMLFSIKADAVAERAIMRLREGKKPVIAFASTMGSFIEQLENERGMNVSDGDVINADFAEVLRKGLDGIMRYTEKNVDGNSIYKKFELSSLSMEAQSEYLRILDKIKTATTGITISPIDVIVRKIQEAGYTVAEVTGRKYELQINPKTNKGLVISRKRINTNDAFRQFNNNEVDVLMINQSGSTGASAHAIVTPKVKAEQVKQRVMIVLQAELDINTEVQKRGRINRTGQILLPIYDYMMSAIPAEKRLMMMLQKKLKSLDANTTSNQKQSTKILDVPDFLNKYGDKIVKEYLQENPDINELLNDPLELTKTKSESRGEVEDAAMKVSGRVAVLSTKMQADFYNEIAERYIDYVDYLKQVGDYDLEVEAMNLETETISSNMIKMGKGGDSAFGEDSNLETVKANVLKKPFTKSELENILKESLGGKEANEIQQALIKEYTSEMEKRLAEELAETKSKYEELTKNIPNEKKLQKILEKQGDGAYQLAVKQREKELKSAHENQDAMSEKAYHNRGQYVERIFKFFHIGRKLLYPIESFGEGQELVLATFCGFMIDRKKKNPYAPSAIKLRFAIANSSKYIAIPASYSETITAIIGSSVDVEQTDLKDLLNEWESFTKKNIVDRNIRHIITGNLLQAFSDFKGKLVSYTTLNGETKKGILMPENWEPPQRGEEKITVPIGKAIVLVKSLMDGKFILTNQGLSIFKTGGKYKLIVPSSSSRGGIFFKNPDILKLVDKNNFETTADKMVATMDENHIEKLVEILQTQLNCSLTVPSFQLKLIQDKAMKMENRKKIELPPTYDDDNESANIRLLELEAEALTIELELLALAA